MKYKVRKPAIMVPVSCSLLVSLLPAPIGSRQMVRMAAWCRDSAQSAPIFLLGHTTASLCQQITAAIGQYIDGANSVFASGMVQAFAVHDSSIFAGTWGDWIYRSTDMGAHWKLLSNGMTNPDIQAFAFSGSYTFVGTAGGVYRSTDNGNTWDSVGLSNKSISSFLVYDNYIFAGTFGGGVFISSDNGTTWNIAGKILPYMYVDAFAVLIVKFLPVHGAEHIFRLIPAHIGLR